MDIESLRPFRVRDWLPEPTLWGHLVWEDDFRYIRPGTKIPDAGASREILRRLGWSAEEYPADGPDGSALLVYAVREPNHIVAAGKIPDEAWWHAAEDARLLTP
jgi:hypothetical protein